MKGKVSTGDSIRERKTRKVLVYAVGLSVPIVTGIIFNLLGFRLRTVAAMTFLLEVLGVAATGDSTLAILTSIVAAATFSFDYLTPSGAFGPRAPENLIALIAFLITAVTGSQLSLRSQRRADEANRRRDEMQALQHFSSSLLLFDSVAATAEAIARDAVQNFGFDRVSLVLRGEPPVRAEQSFSFGDRSSSPETALTLHSAVKAEVRLYGPRFSKEFYSAFQTVTGLLLDRAAGAENRVRFESEQRGEELQRTVLSALAHNFRTPLTSIKMASSALLLARDGNEIESGFAPLSPEQEKDLLIAIDEEADRLQALIRESLELSRLEAHRLHPRLEDCDLKSIVASVMGKLERYVPADRIQLDIPEHLPPLRGDRILFEQMVFQVMDNAWKYSSPAARIWVNARVESTYLILTIQNEGSSIPHDEKERIFERFVRGAGAKKKIEGTGLGLALARTIAQGYGGKLWLDSDPKGPAFRFALPVKRDAEIGIEG